MLQSADVRTGQIVNVDVIADAGSVWGGVVRAKDVQFRAQTSRGKQGQRDEMGFGIMQFTNLAAVVRAGGVEISQARIAKFVSALVSLQGLFEEQLGNTVWFHRLAWNDFYVWIIS